MNLSLINRNTRRLMMSNMNIRTPCRQFQMSLSRKIGLSAATKNDTTSNTHPMPAITNSLKYRITLKPNQRNYKYQVQVHHLIKLKVSYLSLFLFKDL